MELKLQRRNLARLNRYKHAPNKTLHPTPYSAIPFVVTESTHALSGAGELGVVLRSAAWSCAIISEWRESDDK